MAGNDDAATTRLDTRGIPWGNTRRDTAGETALTPLTCSLVRSVSAHFAFAPFPPLARSLLSLTHSAHFAHSLVLPRSPQSWSFDSAPSKFSDSKADDRLRLTPLIPVDLSFLVRSRTLKLRDFQSGPPDTLCSVVEM